MPELPEVEIVRQSLDKKIQKKKVKKVIIVKESKRILKKFVPHLGDFVEVSHF